MKSSLLVVLLSMQLVAGTLAQQPSPTPPQSQQPESDQVVRITTNLVQVDAVVTDKNGKTITDLKPEEVEIYEDGRKQEITNFSYYVVETSPAPERPSKRAAVDKNAPPVPPSRLRIEDVRRSMALVVDDLGLSFDSVYYVRRALKKFVDEQMQPGDLVAIIRTSGGIGALQQFTADKRQLYAAIERVKIANGRVAIGTFSPVSPSQIGPGGSQMKVGEIGEEGDRFREDIFAVGTLGALSYVVRGLRELPGKKSVLLLSEGFRLNDSEDLGRSRRVVDAFSKLTDLANRASVSIYTLDPRGLATLNFDAADGSRADAYAAGPRPDPYARGPRPDQVAQQISAIRQAFSESQDGMSQLADATGGFAIKNRNDLSAGIKQVLADLNGYYLIGYRPDSSTFDASTGRRRFHHLSLKVKRAGNFKVRMRNGFLGTPDEEEAKPRTPGQQLVGALISPFGATGVHLQLTSLFANDSALGSIMRSMLYIDPRDLTFTAEPDGTHTAVFDVLAITFGDNGVPIDRFAKIFTIKLSDKELERTQRQGVVYNFTVPIKKAGAYQLRVALRDSASERIGSAGQFIEAPDIKKNRLMLSGLVLRGESQDAASKQPNSATPGDEGVDQGDAEASPVLRRFKRGMVLNYAYYVYNARLDKTTRQSHVITQVRLFRDGKEFFSGQEIPFDSSKESDLKRLAVGGAIQLGTEMPPGEYVLQVVVTDAAESKPRLTTQWMDFEIVK